MPSWLLLEAEMGAKGGPKGAAGSELNPDIVEGTVAQHLAIGHAVERDTARKAEVFLAGLFADRAGKAPHHLLGHRLH